MEILSGLMIGAVYVAAPGPIGVETLRHGIRGGFGAALAVQGGSALGLIFYAVLALAGAEALLQQPSWRPVAGLVGMALLFYMGVTTIREGHRTLGARAGPSTRSALGTGALLSLANPLDVLFWLSIGGSLLRQREQESLVFLGAFAAGCLLSSFCIALFAAYWQSRLTGRTVRLFSWACGLALIAFGLQLAAMSTT